MYTDMPLHSHKQFSIYFPEKTHSHTRSSQSKPYCVYSNDLPSSYVILYELIDTCLFDSNRRVGVGRSHGTGTSSPPHWQQVKQQAPKPVGWMMCFLLCVYIYIYIYTYVYMLCYMSSVFFGLPIASCALMLIVWYQDACDFWHLFQTTLCY